MARHVFVVLTEPKKGEDAKFNDWYDTIHIPDVLKVPGFIAAQRFVLAEGVPAEGPHVRKYLALYEVETSDIAATMAELGKRAGTPAMMMSPAFDETRVLTSMFRALGPRVEARG